MIQLNNIEKTYRTGKQSCVALKRTNACITQGEFLVITGRSGSGKSTLLNILTGIDHPSAGKVVINDTDITDYSEGEMAQWRGKNIGIVFQFFQLIPNLSTLENILLPMDLVNTVPALERMTDALNLLDMVGLRSHADKMPTELSGGEQQRVAIARALANRAPIIVADEPTGNLDSRSAAIILELFAHLVQTGKTIIMVTHEKERISGTTRQLILQDGEVMNDIHFKGEGRAHEKIV